VGGNWVFSSHLHWRFDVDAEDRWRRARTGKKRGIEAHDVEVILNRSDRRRGDDREEDADGEDDRNTGNAVADFDYPYEFGDSSVWRSNAVKSDHHLRGAAVPGSTG
jgi:hypothetical protein